MASGSASSLPPPCVTTASSGLNPSTCSASRSKKLIGISIGKYALCGSRGLDPPVDLGLHPLPYRIPVGPDDHGSAGRAVLGQLRLGQDVLVPARKVVLLSSQHRHLADDY